MGLVVWMFDNFGLVGISLVSDRSHPVAAFTASLNCRQFMLISCSVFLDVLVGSEVCGGHGAAVGRISGTHAMDDHGDLVYSHDIHVDLRGRVSPLVCRR